MSNSLIDGIDNVKVYDEVPNIAQGSYELEVENLMADRSKQTGNDYFRATVKVLKAEGQGATPVGTTTQILLSSPKFPEYAIKDMKKLVAAVAGMKASEVTQQNVKTIITDEQPAKGNVFKAVVTHAKDDDGTVKTYKSGDPVCNYNFSAAT